MEKNASKENIFSLLWKKCNVLIGYIVAITLAVIFLVCWPFDQYVIAISLIWGFSFLVRLPFGNIETERMSVVIMWSIFCFGLTGIIMQLLKIDGFILFGGIVSGVVAIILYCCIPLLSSFLKYIKFKIGIDIESKDTKYNGSNASMFIYIITLFIVIVNSSELAEKREDQKLVLQLTQESFVPVKKISEELYDGNTFYILEAKGQRFKVSPFEHPEVRDINSNSQVKVLFGDGNDFGLKEVKKVQFKN